jgi:hypothetical protein
MGIREWFKRSGVEEVMSADEVKQNLENEAIRQACQAIDLMNDAFPHLPRYWGFWVERQRGQPPRVLLTRWSPDDVEVLYGNGNPLL